MVEDGSYKLGLKCGRPREGGAVGHTFLDFGLLHLVAEVLLELALVVCGEGIDVELGLADVEGVHGCLWKGCGS